MLPTARRQFVHPRFFFDSFGMTGILATLRASAAARRSVGIIRLRRAWHPIRDSHCIP
jgi:hypothetical protein